MKITIEGSPEELEAMLRKFEGTTPALPVILIPIPPSPTTVPIPEFGCPTVYPSYTVPSWSQPIYCGSVTGGMMFDGIVATNGESIY